MRRHSRVALAAALSLAVLSVVPAGAQADYPRNAYVTMTSDPGDWVGQGVASRVWEQQTATIALSGDLSWITVQVAGGASGESYRLEFAAPPGEQLHPGLYPSVQRAAFRQAGHGGLDVHGEGRGCNEVGGQFDVKELFLNSAGEIKRLWITYEQHCEKGVPAMFGEVQLGMRRDYEDIVVMPAELSWPALDLGASGSTAPVSVLNSGSADLRIQSASVGGPMAGDFLEQSDDCTGTTLAPGGSCKVGIKFVPSGPGPRLARLRLTDAKGRVHRPLLWGGGIGGSTRFEFGGPPGERISQGLQWSYRPGQAIFSFSFSFRSHVALYLTATDGTWWRADFEAPWGQELAPGHYADARRHSSSTGAGLSISGDGRSCNESNGDFTITDLAWDADDVLQRFGATFEQHCEGRPEALTGALDYRLPTGDVTPPESVTNLQVSRSSNTATVSWTNPADPDYLGTIVRWVYGTTPPGGPHSGQLLHAGTGTRRQMAASIVRDVSVAAFAVDAAGNVSAIATATGDAPAS